MEPAALAPGLCLEVTGKYCCAGGNSPLSTDHGEPCPRGGRHVREVGVPGPGRPSRSGGRSTARPSEPLTFARPGGERSAATVQPAPGCAGTGSPRCAPFRLQLPGARLASCARPGAPQGPSPERPGRPVPPPFCPLSSGPPQTSPGGDRRPEAGTRPSGPTRARPAQCEDRSLSRGGPTLPRARPGPEPREVARSRAPEGRTRPPCPLPRPAASPPPARSRNQ